VLADGMIATRRPAGDHGVSRSRAASEKLAKPSGVEKTVMLAGECVATNVQLAVTLWVLVVWKRLAEGRAIRSAAPW